MKGDKYSIDELKKLPPEARSAGVGLILANELYRIRIALEKSVYSSKK